jgi:protein-tyrosine phosphatase
MIDLHCHILPGLDDGPPTLEAAVALARGAVQDGITTIAATPHVDWSHPDIDAQRVGLAVAALRARLDAAGVEVAIVEGAEVAGTWATALGNDELQALTLGRAGWLLLECPLSATLTPGFAEVARSLARRGHRLLLAHPERCPLFLRSPESLEALIGEGMLAQVTAGALSGRFGRTIREFAAQLVDHGSAHVVASDGHGEKRPASIGSELAAAQIDPRLVNWLTHDMPAALLAGEALPKRPEVIRRRPRSRLLRLTGAR